jgi:hypothetical protein
MLATLAQPAAPPAAAVVPWDLVAAAAGAIVLLFLLLRLRHLARRVRSASARLRRLETQMLRLRQRAAAADALASLARAGVAPRFEPEFTSRSGEDLFLYDLFEGRNTGFFIEVGLLDGYTFSATYALEALGWHGLLVEADPERYAACVQRRPHSLVAHAALGRPPAAGPGRSADFTAGSGPDRRAVRVPHLTLDDALDAAAAQLHCTLGAPAGRPIDAAVINPRADRQQILDGFDLERFRPRVLVVNDTPFRNQPGPAAYLARRHYRPVARLGHALVFVRTDDPALIERASLVASRDA